MQKWSNKKRLIVAGVAAAAVVAAVTAGVVGYQKWQASQPMYALDTRPGMQHVKKEAGEALPLVEMTRGAAVVDTTPEFVDYFGDYVESQFEYPQGRDVTVTSTECLSAWAAAELPERAGTTAATTVEACGMTVAFIAGGYGIIPFDLLLRADNESELSTLRDVLYDADELVYASVASEDGNAVLIAAGRPAR